MFSLKVSLQQYTDMKMRDCGSNVRKSRAICSQNCESGVVGEEMEEGKGDKTAN